MLRSLQLQEVIHCGEVCAVFFALAGRAGSPKAFCGAATATVLAWLATCKSFPASEWFFRWITQTLNASAYYAKAELRGAVDQIKPGKYLYAVHPHGCLSAGWTWNLFWNSTFHDKAGRVAFCIDINLRERNPLFRLVCDWYAGEKRFCICADKSAIKKAMATGDSIALIPGGFEDATLMKCGKERTAIKKRKGFVKYCLEHGYSLVPVYTFGEGDTFWTFTPLLKFRLWLNKFGIPAVAFFGNPVCPFLPFPNTPLLTYVGRPLALPTIERPSNED